MTENNLKSTLENIIFYADTKAGKAYDIVLIITIILSVITVMVDSVSYINKQYGHTLQIIEWFFTILFTIDYIIRLLCVGNPFRYARSFFGIIDLLGVIPTYLSLVFPGSRFLITIRFLRILRIFRVLKLFSYLREGRLLLQILNNSKQKIIVFLFTVISLTVVLGSLMYVIEGASNGFTSIPASIYWAIVTLTTVGYGDISPVTPIGQTLAAIIMLLGYSIIVIPTGLLTAIITLSFFKSKTPCTHCNKKGQDIDAIYCKYCGELIN